MTRYVTMGLTIVAGVALFEAALIPGMVIGAAAVLAPSYLPKLRRQLRPLFESTEEAPAERARSAPARSERETPPTLPAFGIKRAIAKTITFRIIVTSLDFTANYLVIGELAAAAGLSGFALAAGPLFYFVHETAWNRLGPTGDTVELSVLPSRQSDGRTPHEGETGITISRALAKTITFRTVATAVDFTANYVVVGELATAVLLSAFGFVLGPFVYLGHEKAWDYYDPPRRTFDPAVPDALLPAPA